MLQNWINIFWMIFFRLIFFYIKSHYPSSSSSWEIFLIRFYWKSCIRIYLSISSSFFLIFIWLFKVERNSIILLIDFLVKILILLSYFLFHRQNCYLSNQLDYLYQLSDSNLLVPALLQSLTANLRLIYYDR